MVETIQFNSDTLKVGRTVQVCQALEIFLLRITFSFIPIEDFSEALDLKNPRLPFFLLEKKTQIGYVTCPRSHSNIQSLGSWFLVHCSHCPCGHRGGGSVHRGAVDAMTKCSEPRCCVHPGILTGVAEAPITGLEPFCLGKSGCL